MLHIQMIKRMCFHLKLAKITFLEANAVITHLAQNCSGPSGLIQLVTGLCTA